MEKGAIAQASIYSSWFSLSTPERDGRRSSEDNIAGSTLLRMNIIVKKVGGIWHGYVEGHPEIDERALTEEIARRKATEAARRVVETSKEQQPVRR